MGRRKPLKGRIIVVRSAALLLLYLIFFASRPVAAERSPCPSCIADFAVYNPQYEDDGVWEEEVTALEQMFKQYGWTSRSVSHTDLNDGVLGSGAERRFRALIAPGGWSWYREQAVTTSGESSVRAFLADGGHYVGFCAGAYWAATRLIWAMNTSDLKNGFSSPRDYSGIFPYELAIYPGDAKGPLGWMPWRNGTNVNFSVATLNLKNPTIAKLRLPRETRFLYGGGPFFPEAEKIPGLEVWARAKAPSAQVSSKTGANQPTIIHFPIKNGSATLFSYHPDVLIKHDADGIALTQFFDEKKIKWDTGTQTFDQINHDSWNIVHAALQIAADQEVTPLVAIVSHALNN